MFVHPNSLKKKTLYKFNDLKCTKRVGCINGTFVKVHSYYMQVSLEKLPTHYNEIRNQTTVVIMLDEQSLDLD